MFRIYAILIVVGLLGGALYGAKYYYDTTQATIGQLRENNAKLVTANQLNEETIAKQSQDAIMLGELNSQLTKDLQRAEEYGDELRSTLNKHNLTHLANKKPGLIEKRMQNATDQLWDELEDITTSE
jgi:hypothetical protein